MAAPPGYDDGTSADPPLEERAARWRADAAVAERRRGWWLSRQAEEEASLAGVLAELAGRGAPVALTVLGAGRRVGRVWAVGGEVVGLRAAGALDVIVAMSAVASVRPAVAADDGVGAGPTPVGDRPAPAASQTLGEVLAGVVDGRRRVTVTDRAGERTDGELVWVGADVALVRTPSGPVHVALALVAEVAFTDR